MDWTCRAHIKEEGVVVHKAYLRRFSLTLVGVLRGVITNHYQHTEGSNFAQDPVRGEAFLTRSTTAGSSSCLLHVKHTFYIRA